MTTERHAYFDGKIQLYRRPESRHWHCSASIGGKQQRSTTKEENLTRAKEAAWDWYLTLSGKYAAGTLQTGMTFKKAAELFLAEYETITQGERSPSYVASQEMNVRVHLMPYFGKMTVNEINGGTVQQYRAHRQTSRKDKDGNPVRPSRSALHHETITLRHILRTANRHGALSHTARPCPARCCRISAWSSATA